MTEHEKSDERFIRLETQLAYQQKLIAELNEVVLEHTRTVDRLVAKLALLEGVFRDQRGEPVGHERPPHY